MTEPTLKGMTWNHPRGIDPLLAASEQWRSQTGVTIEWERRSLQDFESYPVEELARRYDLIVIDHPHVGQVCESECLVPLDALIDAETLSTVAAGSVGGSYRSYNWAGRQWALPIDAAAQVQAWVPERIERPLNHVGDALPLLRDGTAIIPLRAPHSLMTLFSLCGLNSIVLDVEGEDLFPPHTIAYDQFAALVAASSPAAWSMDPIAVLDAMADASSRLAVAPFTYGYVSYARPGFRSALVRFADLPMIEDAPCGSALGGTGIAVSRFGQAPEEGARFAVWVASGPIQREVFAAAGGQPAHAEAWGDNAVNQATLDFYRATRRTLDAAWVRPRHNGYMKFQQLASDRLERGATGREPAHIVIAELNRLYRECR